MITIELVSEDFSAQELLLYLEEQKAIDGLEVRIVEAKKEGLSVLHDAVQLVFSEEMAKEIAKEAILVSLGFALAKAQTYLMPKPHILIKYTNGQSKKILYEGKSDKAIVRELMAEVNDGEVIRVFFKS
jgi:uncharacterized protein YneR